jgi:hypothetical protein
MLEMKLRESDLPVGTQESKRLRASFIFVWGTRLS